MTRYTGAVLIGGTQSEYRGAATLALTLTMTGGGYQVPQYWMRKRYGRGHSRFKRGL